jgi:RHS repeat-associated protein
MDGETGYQYHGARYYNEELGRYMSVDPLASQYLSWSTYNYAFSNPISFIDPTGMGPEKGSKDKPKNPVYDDPVKAFEKYYNNHRELHHRNIGGKVFSDGSVYIYARDGSVSGQTVVDYFKASEKYTKKYKAQQAKREQNSKSLIGQYFGQGWGMMGVYFDNPNSVFRDQWEKNRKKVQAVNDFAEGMMYEAFYIISGEELAAGVFRGAKWGYNYVKHVRTTQRLQKHVNKAVKIVDNLGDEALTVRQYRAVQRNPNLRPMYRGNRIDVMTRNFVKNDAKLRHLKSNYTNGPDFVNPANNNWWDITTKAQWQKHVDKYGPGGTLLRTN